MRAQTGPFLFTRRAWAMPNRDTFSIGPVREFILPYVQNCSNWSSVDPFARRSELARVTNDLNPDMPTHYHMDAEEFCKEMARQGKVFDLAFFDPPYSPRQISECYKGIGRAVGSKETQNAALYSRVRDALLPILSPRAVVLSFGWNSNGMGRGRGFEILELMLVAHGGAHNDTICLAEQRV
jgi:hypothetical protein